MLTENQRKMIELKISHVFQSKNCHQFSKNSIQYSVTCSPIYNFSSTFQLPQKSPLIVNYITAGTWKWKHSPNNVWKWWWILIDWLTDWLTDRLSTGSLYFFTSPHLSAKEVTPTEVSGQLAKSFRFALHTQVSMFTSLPCLVVRRWNPYENA